MGIIKSTMHKSKNSLHSSIFLILYIALCVQVSFAQELKKSTKTERIDGKSFYIHTVEKGQTLYSICKVYEISQNDLVFENPELINGLKPNQILKIPVKTKDAKENPAVINENNLLNVNYHTVEKGETFYSISKKYNLSVDTLQKNNASFNGVIKKGDKIILSKANFDKVTPPTPLPLAETEKKITGNEIYNVGLFLPLYLAKNDSAFTYENKDEQKTIYPKSIPAVEFYEGFSLAIDSLKKLGVNCNILVYDIPSDSLQIVNFLKKPELKELNLIIGPFHSDDVGVVADFCKRNKIMMIAPFSQASKALLGNSYLCKATPSSSTQVEQLANYISINNKGSNILVAHNNLSKEKTSAEIFKNKANKILGTDSVTVIVYKSIGLKGLTGKLSTTKNNIIFVPSNDQAFVTDFLNKMNTLTKDYKIIIVGMESWIGYENLEINTIQNTQLHIPSNNYVDYANPETKKFIQRFRETYKTEPNKFAYEGYDIAMYHLLTLKNYGITFMEKTTEFKSNGINTQFNYFKTGTESGYENQKVFILKYQDFSLIPAN